MIKVITVDDERLALDRFTRIIGNDNRVTVEGAFTSPSEALAFVKNNKIDAAFLDIEMPGMTGLELARKIREQDPSVYIVFVTAYDSYAVDAFKSRASGYLLKPVERADITEQIDYICETRGEIQLNRQIKLCVRCLGDFVCYTSASDESSTIHWKTLKAEELFALLVHYRGIAVPKDVLIDMLWPDADPQKSANLFRVTCTYIRNTLAECGFKNALLRDLNKYRLDVSILDCDYYSFDDITKDANAASENELNKAIGLYAGEYFQKMPYDWAIQRRAFLESKFKDISHIVSTTCTERGDYQKACDILSSVLIHDPYDNATAVEYTKLKMKSGDTDGALHFYREFSNRLMRETGDSPQSDISEIFDK